MTNFELLTLVYLYVVNLYKFLEVYSQKDSLNYVSKFFDFMGWSRASEPKREWLFDVIRFGIVTIVSGLLICEGVR
ncbi:TPA: hypothetical protein U1B12_000482 [Streptococcus suis]|uniref:hypothetical protein n=1 Tax=Streptococcus suis TaxID=1307 RepID=UPI00209B8A2B|nr:hypothetical protein [Streptococcus suis]MCO8200442.1 hypothetical protein [Streptococcus suis]MCO8217979.1 hypothetical protein [Streptococcus suis]HEM3467362.1 hypothetical protein [Streptococcus suis]HEM3478073.1 hypothetical protein [Streptococcus suis]